MSASSIKGGVSVEIMTENNRSHDVAVFFNRGAAASRAYNERFGDNDPGKIPEALWWLSRGLEEAVILSTCNRVEIYGRGREPGTVEQVAQFLVDHGRLAPEASSHLYRLEGEDAVRHAFRVAASLDSMVLGEPQILGQVKAAYEDAAAAASL